MTEKAIEITDLFFSYEDALVLRRANVGIRKGAFVGVIGPNGGGKTTLMKLLMGFLKPDRGSVAVFGKPPEESRTQIGYVPQFHRTDREFPITTLELVLLGALSQLSFWGKYPRDIIEKAKNLLDEFDLGEMMNSPFGSLSGGQAQKALLARALISDPDLLLLDEPVANIDAKSIAAILDRLGSYKNKKTILMVTHDLKTIVERVDQVLCVQGAVSSYLPREICEHFAMGLYHTPLIEISETHFGQKQHVSADFR